MSCRDRREGNRPTRHALSHHDRFGHPSPVGSQLAARLRLEHVGEDLTDAPRRERAQIDPLETPRHASDVSHGSRVETASCAERHRPAIQCASQAGRLRRRDARERVHDDQPLAPHLIDDRGLARAGGTYNQDAPSRVKPRLDIAQNRPPANEA